MRDESDLRGLFPEEISRLTEDMGEPAYRGRQIFAWLQKEAAGSYQEMTNISMDLRRRFEETWPLSGPELIRRQESADGTKKFLFSLADGLLIESVLMSHREKTGHIRHTACLSSQVGCAMGCSFCSTASLGFQRNLTAGEIVSQVLLIAAAEKTDVHNAVYMGMGEPFLNMGAVKRSILLLNHPQGQNIGARRITVSTCGLPEGIRSMANWDIRPVLAVSLHAADDETRSRLTPVNRRYPLSELIAACRDYTEKTGKRITFEYVMLGRVNTDGKTAARLGALLKGIPCNLNLIPVNPGAHCYDSPTPREQASFLTALEQAGLDAVIRQERGRDIDGACGQLAGNSII